MQKFELMLVLSTGALVASYAYDGFGRTVAQSGPMADAFSLRYSTKYMDPETGLSYFGYRYYSPQLGRWLTRDPLEEEGGINLYEFCENASTYKYDPLGQDVYLYQGNNCGDPLNDWLHQSVVVDLWSDDCPPRKIGMQGFSFGYENEWGWNVPSFSWLGHTGFTLPGYYMIGVVYKAKVIGSQIARKRTTVRQDREWLKYMEKKVGTKDVYSVGRHNCRNFSQSEFDAAPSRKEAK